MCWRHKDRGTGQSGPEEQDSLDQRNRTVWTEEQDSLDRGTGQSGQRNGTVWTRGTGQSGPEEQDSLDLGLLSQQKYAVAPRC